MGHGPDLDSNEGIRAMTVNFLRNDETYQNGGYGLSVTEIKKVKTNPNIFETTFIYPTEHNDMFYTGSLEVKGNQARWAAGSNKTIEIEKVLEMILKKALYNGSGDTNIEIKSNSQISDILKTEQQLLVTRYVIQQIFQSDMKKMDLLWNKLSAKKTFSEWLEVLKTEE